MIEVIGTFTSDEIRTVVSAYNKRGSLEFAAMEEDVPFSFASVQRIITLASEMGLVEKNSMGRPLINRERIFELMEKFPHATVGQIAMLADCSKATVYRARRGE